MTNYEKLMIRAVVEIFPLFHMHLELDEACKHSFPSLFTSCHPYITLVSPIVWQEFTINGANTLISCTGCVVYIHAVATTVSAWELCDSLHSNGLVIDDLCGILACVFVVFGSTLRFVASLFMLLT